MRNLTDYKPYTGIGSRDIDEDMFHLMVRIATQLALDSYTLRSGGAMGSDTAFEIGSSKKEIYLPWTNFGNNDSRLVIADEHLAYEVARKHHPAWDRLKFPVKKLMARNVLQVLGNTLNEPSLFVVCYTKDGCESHVTRTSKTGGTGLAISVASKAGIPIFNLKNRSSLAKLIQFTGIEI